MKTNATKMVMELKGKLKLITSTNATWDMWCRVFDNHNHNNIVNLKIEMTYKNDSKVKVFPILMELLRSLLGVTELEL